MTARSEEGGARGQNPILEAVLRPMTHIQQATRTRRTDAAHLPWVLAPERWTVFSRTETTGLTKNRSVFFRH